MQLNVLDDLAEAMKALGGKKWVDMNTVPGRKGEQSWHNMQSQ